MTIRDQGPNYMMPYGLTSRTAVPYANEEERGTRVDSGILSRKLQGHPVMRFFATAGVTLGGMAVASSLIREGGVKLAEGWGEQALADTHWKTKLISDVRKLQGLFDDWEGISRQVEPGESFFFRKDKTSFFFTEAEKQAIAQGKDPVAAWTFRDSIRRSMVRQARRLPYELPAAYAAQRLVTDPLIGSQHPEDRPKWYNPVDVLGDFAQQSFKNLGQLLLPLDAGASVLGNSWKKIMSLGDYNVNDLTNAQRAGRTFSINLQTQLERVGADASSLLQRTAAVASKSTGAFGTAIHEALGGSKSLVQHLYEVRTEASRQGRKVKFGDYFGSGAGDIELGPFGGAQTFVRTYRDAYRAAGERMLANGGDRVLTGTSTLERIAQSVHRLARGPRDFRFGEFATQRINASYQDLVAQRLMSTGVDEETAYNVMRGLTLRRLPNQRGLNTADRIFGFGEQGYTDALDAGLTQFGMRPMELGTPGERARRLLGLSGEGRMASPREVFEGAVADANRDFFANRDLYMRQIHREFTEAYQNQIVPFAQQRLKKSKLPYELFAQHEPGAPGADFLYREIVSTMGYDASHMDRGQLVGILRNAGVDPANFHQLRAYAVRSGVIGPSWNRGGFNLFGLRGLTVDRAMQRGFFDGLDPEVMSHLRRLTQSLETTDPQVGSLSRLRVGPGVFESKSGRIIDLSPLTRAFRSGLDLLSDQLQIPLLHLNPLRTAMYEYRRGPRESPIIQMATGMHRLPFGGLQGELRPTDALLMMKDRSSSGFPAVIRSTVDGAVIRTESRRLPGRFRTYATDSSSIAGRTMRFAIGERGKIPDQPRSQNRFARFFNIDEDQPSSIWRLLGRWRGRDTDPRNPRIFARMLAENGADELSEQDFIRGFNSLGRATSRSGIPLHALRRLEQSGALSETLGEPAARLAGLRSRDEIVSFARQLLRDNPVESLAPNDENAQRLIRQARRRVYSYLNNSSREGYFEGLAPASYRRVGINRRLDQFKNELYQYLVTQKGILSEFDETAPGSAENVITELLNNAFDLKNLHKISEKEYTEFRAAILGLQINLTRNIVSSSGRLTPYSAARETAERVLGRGGRQLISEYADYTDRIPYTEPGGSNIFSRGINAISRARSRAERGFARTFTAADYEYPGTEYNPFGGQENVFAPTLQTAFFRHPVRALASATGLSTYSDPDAFSGAGVITSHLFQRLNRPFSSLGLGLDETEFRGPIDFYVRGLVGKRVLPLVAGTSALYTIDSTLGGYTHRKDQNGQRVYSPLFLGMAASGIAHGQMLAAGILPGGETYGEKREELLHGEVPVRRGRWWPLGTTPWRGDRIQYFRPSWYRRLKSGYKYTDQDYGSPLEHFLFDEDFSPLRVLDPYHFERKHYQDRPYPVTGEYFTGPWGPLTGFLNATIGRVLKPPIKMHQAEVAAGLQRYQARGAYGIQAPNVQLDEGARVLVRTAKRGTVQIPAAASGVLGLRGGLATGGGGGGGYGGGGAGGGAGVGGGGGAGGGRRGVGTAIGGAAFVPYGAPPGGGIARGVLNRLNRFYETNKDPMPRRTAYGYPVVLDPNGLQPRVSARAEPVNPGSFGYQASMLGYQSQELAGIYGFAFGQSRQALGYGKSDFTPQRPILQSASRAYGAERAFWDLNLGGMGDFPTPLEGDLGNLEFSEIARRFIPHRRRDENELNPIPNALGRRAPWLPGNDYFLNLREGDPYAAVPEGELRLPGPAYERLYGLHSDSTGRYGLVDKLRILGDVAPWSNQYKALQQVVANAPLSPEEHDEVQRIKKQVAAKKKTVEFSPYRYANQDFKTVPAQITGVVPGKPDQFMTNVFDAPIRLSGVRASRKNKGKGAADYLSKLVGVGDRVDLTYDAGLGELTNQTGTIDVYMNANGTNINERLMKSGYGHEAKVNTPLDAYENESAITRGIKSLGEHLAHRNTLLNAKFLPRRTALEDWERRNVYGATFPQWQHPVRDFLMPMIYRAANRDVVTASLALGGVGAMFGTTPVSRRVGALIGGVTGLATSVFTDTGTQSTGQRFIPKTRKKELALEEYMDVLKYVKFSNLYGQARTAAIKKEHTDPESLMKELPDGTRQFIPIGPITQQALQYRKEIKRTMYGGDPFGDVMDLYQAIPKRKRKHFMEFLNAPVRDRSRILSTAGRLERRIYEARWGLKVEQRPDLDKYFSEHELPGPSWEGWSPDVDLETVKLKVANHMGLDASQMGYYPQQVKEANLLNPSYPDYDHGTQHREVARQLRQMLAMNGISGSVHAVPTPFPGTRAILSGGVAA